MTDLSKYITERSATLKQKECVSCGKKPNDPQYLCVNDYNSSVPTCFPVCKDCPTPTMETLEALLS